jgi:hypothetical protein
MLLDSANTLGLSRDVIGWIERRRWVTSCLCCCVRGLLGTFVFSASEFRECLCWLGFISQHTRHVHFLRRCHLHIFLLLSYMEVPGLIGRVLLASGRFWLRRMHYHIVPIFIWHLFSSISFVRRSLPLGLEKVVYNTRSDDLVIYIRDGKHEHVQACRSISDSIAVWTSSNEIGWLALSEWLSGM